MSVNEIVENLEIKKVDGLKFGNNKLYTMPEGYAFFHKQLGYLAFSEENKRRLVPIPYIPIGGKVALQSILDTGGFCDLEGIEWLKPLD